MKNETPITIVAIAAIAGLISVLIIVKIHNHKPTLEETIMVPNVTYTRLSIENREHWRFETNQDAGFPLVVLDTNGILTARDCQLQKIVIPSNVNWNGLDGTTFFCKGNADRRLALIVSEIPEHYRISVDTDGWYNLSKNGRTR